MKKFKYSQRVMLARKIHHESMAVRENSMNILHEFEDIDYGAGLAEV